MWCHGMLYVLTSGGYTPHVCVRIHNIRKMGWSANEPHPIGRGRRGWDVAATGWLLRMSNQPDAAFRVTQLMQLASPVSVKALVADTQERKQQSYSHLRLERPLSHLDLKKKIARAKWAISTNCIPPYVTQIVPYTLALLHCVRECSVIRDIRVTFAWCTTAKSHKCDKYGFIDSLQIQSKYDGILYV